MLPKQIIILIIEPNNLSKRGTADFEINDDDTGSLGRGV